MNKNDIKKLAKQYLYTTLNVISEDPYSEEGSAFDKVFDITHEDPEKAWALVLEMFYQAADNKSLSIVASGPLEDTISNFPYEIIDRVLVLAKEDARFRKCLKGVWGKNRMPQEIGKRIDEAVKEEPNW